MRIAIVSDIHGNIWALEAVLADIRKQGADVIVNAGDLLSGPLEPSATADLLMSLDLPTVRGNHERQLLACEHQRGGAADQFAFENTSKSQRDWLADIPSQLVLSDEVFVCHGTPSNDLFYFLERVSSAGARLASRVEVEQHADGIQQGLILCGHSHKPRTFTISGGRLVVNPGSVGLQAYDAHLPFYHTSENGSPHARYAICEMTEDGWNVSHRCVDYAYDKAVMAAKRNGRQDWAIALETGLVG
jgi:putative phosphoesterase